jgi:hypothetical protein
MDTGTRDVFTGSAGGGSSDYEFMARTVVYKLPRGIEKEDVQRVREALEQARSHAALVPRAARAITEMLGRLITPARAAARRQEALDYAGRRPQPTRLGDDRTIDIYLPVGGGEEVRSTEQIKRTYYETVLCSSWASSSRLARYGRGGGGGGGGGGDDAQHAPRLACAFSHRCTGRADGGAPSDTDHGTLVHQDIARLCTLTVPELAEKMRVDGWLPDPCAVASVRAIELLDVVPVDFEFQVQDAARSRWTPVDAVAVTRAGKLCVLEFKAASGGLTAQSERMFEDAFGEVKRVDDVGIHLAQCEYLKSQLQAALGSIMLRDTIERAFGRDRYEFSSPIVLRAGSTPESRARPASAFSGGGFRGRPIEKRGAWAMGAGAGAGAGDTTGNVHTVVAAYRVRLWAATIAGHLLECSAAAQARHEAALDAQRRARETGLVNSGGRRRDALAAAGAGAGARAGVPRMAPASPLVEAGRDDDDGDGGGDGSRGRAGRERARPRDSIDEQWDADAEALAVVCGAFPRLCAGVLRTDVRE